jgi:cytochrome c oxidase assembly protein subunit 15
MVLACIPILGTVAQAVLGGITVRTGLHPATVSAHFLVSMLIVAGTAALVARSADGGDGPPVSLVPRPVTVLAWALVAVSAVVVFVGAVVTGSGPYSGDVHSENRYSFDPRTVSWLHADAVLLFTGMLIGLLVVLTVVKAPASALRRAWILFAIAVAQGALGYTQYFAGEPVALVTIHVLGSVLVWVTVLLIPPTLRSRS